MTSTDADPGGALRCGQDVPIPPPRMQHVAIGGHGPPYMHTGPVAVVDGDALNADDAKKETGATRCAKGRA